MVHRLISIDWGLKNSAVVLFLLNDDGDLFAYISPPCSALGMLDYERAHNNPVWIGALVSQLLHNALMEYRKPGSPFWPFSDPEWATEDPVNDVVIEAGNPPRPQNWAIIAAVTASMHMLFPRAMLHQQQRQQVMRHFGIPVGHGHDRSKQASISCLQNLVSRMDMVHNCTPQAEYLLANDHVCDALLQGLYTYRGRYRRLFIDAPATREVYSAPPLHA